MNVGPPNWGHSQVLCPLPPVPEPSQGSWPMAGRHLLFPWPIAGGHSLCLCPYSKQKPRDTEPRTFALDHRPKAKPRAITQVREHVRDTVQLKTTSTISYLIHGLSLVKREEKKPGPSAARRDDQRKDAVGEQGRGSLGDHDPTSPRSNSMRTRVRKCSFNKPVLMQAGTGQYASIVYIKGDWAGLREVVWVVHTFTNSDSIHQRGQEPGSCSVPEVECLTGTNLTPKGWRVPRLLLGFRPC